MKTAFAAIAAVFLLLGPAAAKSVTISLDGHCDVDTIKITQTSVVVNEPTNGSCETGFGQGFKVKKSGATVLVAGMLIASEPSTQFTFVFDYPLVTGGHWYIY